jgi:hypothetical protein
MFAYTRSAQKGPLLKARTVPIILISKKAMAVIIMNSYLPELVYVLKRAVSE